MNNAKVIRRLLLFSVAPLLIKSGEYYQAPIRKRSQMVTTHLSHLVAELMKDQDTLDDLDILAELRDFYRYVDRIANSSAPKPIKEHAMTVRHLLKSLGEEFKGWRIEKQDPAHRTSNDTPPFRISDFEGFAVYGYCAQCPDAFAQISPDELMKLLGCDPIWGQNGLKVVCEASDNHETSMRIAHVDRETVETELRGLTFKATK